MQIIIGEVLPIDKLVNRAWVCPITRQDVDIGREGQDLVIMDLNRHAELVKDLNAGQPQVVHIAPGLKYVDLQFLALG